MTKPIAIKDTLSDKVGAIRFSLKTSRDEAFEKYRAKPLADTLLTSLRRAADQALRQLLEVYPLPKGAALAAVGGFGRGELYPFSDVDLLILWPADPCPAAEATLSGLVAAMWDVGLSRVAASEPLNSV